MWPDEKESSTSPFEKEPITYPPFDEGDLIHYAKSLEPLYDLEFMKALDEKKAYTKPHATTTPSWTEFFTGKRLQACISYNQGRYRIRRISLRPPRNQFNRVRLYRYLFGLYATLANVDIDLDAVEHA